jgi:spermidine synthase
MATVRNSPEERPALEIRSPRVAAAGPLLAVGGAFFASGAAALVYQVAWQRILALQSGVGIYSIAMIVGAFMAGLGAGSHLGGALSARVSPRRALRLFAALELGIAAFGAASCWLYYDVLYVRHAALYGVPWRAALLHFVGLLAPTLLMGMSLPFLVRAFVVKAEGAGRTIGFLYGVNVLGASAGAWLTPWLLMRHLGVRGAVLAAVAANLAAALLTVALDRLWSAREEPLPPRAPAAVAEGHEAAGARPLSLWLGLYALSGFCALSLELLWFRMMDVAVKSTAFTFGTVLSIYLLGSGLGSLIGSSAVERARRPLRLFLLCQCAMLAYSALGLIAIAALPVDAPIYQWFFQYWAGAKGDGALGANVETSTLLRLYVVLPVLLYGPPTLLMGLSFPVLQRAVHDDPATSGRKVGLLQAANIAGCTAGSLLVGLWLLSAIGTTGTLRLLMVCGVLFAVVGIACYGRRSIFVALAVGLALLAMFLPGQDGLWLRLHGRADGESAFVEEDATAVIGMVGDNLNRWGVWVNGKTDSLLPWGGMHTFLGAVPVLVHPEPREIAIIGLGSGDTAWAAGCRAETTRVRVFEICAPQHRLLARLSTRAGFPKVIAFLQDGRYEHLVADGRNALELEDRRYDVIELDALRPRSAYAGNLYSDEFFRLCARRLKPGGVMCSWGPTSRTRATFARVFPHVLASDDGLILIGANDPIAVDQEAWRGRLRASARYLGAPRADEISHVLRRVGALSADALPSEAVAGSDVNHDLYPRDEFIAPRAGGRISRLLAGLERR